LALFGNFNVRPPPLPPHPLCVHPVHIGIPTASINARY
jgi:hypothetical protein